MASLDRKLVKKLREKGHHPLAASPNSGVDTLTGKGLAAALGGAQVVVDVSNAPTWDDAAVLNFFQTSARNLLTEEEGRRRAAPRGAVGRRHRPAPRQRLLPREARPGATVKAATVPYTILRATQFFEFIGRIADSSTDGETVRLPPVLIQPEAADDVAAALAEVAVSAPVNGTVELAGPEQFRLDELARRVLRAHNDPRTVIADVHARYFDAELDDHSLIPDDNPRIAPTRFVDWLSQSTAGQNQVLQPRRFGLSRTREGNSS